MKCDHCPSLFHTSSQCKLGPKSLKRTPSEEISRSRIEDYFVFTERVNDSTSPFSFTIDSLANNDGFYIDKGADKSRLGNGSDDDDVCVDRRVIDRSHHSHGLNISDQSHRLNTDQSQSQRNISDQKQRDGIDHSQSNSHRNGNIDQSQRSGSDQRTFTGRNYDNHRRNEYRGYNSNWRDSRVGSEKFGDRSDSSKSVNDLSFTIQNDHSESIESRNARSQKSDLSFRAPENNYTPKKITVTEVQSGKYAPVAHGNDGKRLKIDDSSRKIQLVNENSSTGDLQGSSRNVKDSTSAGLSTKDNREKGTGYSRIAIDIDSNGNSSSTDASKAPFVNETSNSNAVTQSNSPEITILDSISVPRSVKLTPSQSLEISLENKNQDEPREGLIDITIESRVSSTQSTPFSKVSALKVQEKDGDNSHLHVKNLNYHHMKYEIKRRNVYAELDASISLEMSKMNTTISELEVALFENAPTMGDVTSSLITRLRSQRDCLKQLKDTYLKQLNEIEDHESLFMKENLESIGGSSRKRNASEADLESEVVNGSEKQKPKIALNISPSAKKDIITQKCVSSIFDDSNIGYPVNARIDSNVFSPSNGLSSVASILDGKPRSVLFPHDKVGDSLQGILFSSTLENKLQIWDISTFSPVKSIPFNGEREKSEKLSLPEDMCWVSPNSVLISSRKTEKTQDQVWNNLTLLYDLRRSMKPGGFKYKILNFKEHGHGAISVIKGIPNKDQNTTRWITGGYNNKVYMWTIGDLSADTTLDSKLLINEHTSTITAFHYCTHKDYIYSGGLDGKIFGYNLDGQVQFSFSVKPKKIRDIHQIGSNPSNLLVTAVDRESEFLIYDALNKAPVMQFGSKKELTTADDKFERVRSMYQHSAVHPNGYLVCMGDHNTSKINMWDIRKPNVPLQFDVHDKGQTERGKSKYLSLVLGFHNSGGKEYLYSLGSDKRIVRIDLGSVF